MSISSWLRKQTISPVRRRQACFQPRLETLEDRCLLTGGMLDPTFGTGGLVTTPLGNYARAFAVATYSSMGTANDGKIVAVGDAFIPAGRNSTEYMAIVRYNLDGTLDQTFGGTGKIMTTLGRAMAVQIQPDGRVLVAGNSGSEFTVVRYNTNGSLDNSFGTKGKVVTTFSKGSNDLVESMILQADGKIVVAGETNVAKTSHWDLALVRYNANGSLDTTFGTGGKVITHFANSLDSHYNPHTVNLALDQSGKLVVGAQVLQTGAVIARYNANGALDTGFGANHTGIVNLGASFSNPSVAVQADHSIVVSSDMQPGNGTFSLSRLKPDGTMDTSFGSGGVVIISSVANGFFARAVTIQADGGILVAGVQRYVPTSPSGFMVARFNTNGNQDTTFGTNGIFTGATECGGYVSLALEPDGRIVVAGYTLGQSPTADTFQVDRLLTTGPQIGSFTATPNGVASGSLITLMASNIVDTKPAATITQVAFYVDTNGNGKMDPATDRLLGYATQISPGVWTFAFNMGLAPNSYKLFAQARDSLSVFGDPTAIDLSVI